MALAGVGFRNHILAFRIVSRLPTAERWKPKNTAKDSTFETKEEPGEEESG